MHLSDDRIASLTLDETDNGVLMANSYNRVAFPVPNLTALFNMRRSF
jgi:hypothetical protein